MTETKNIREVPLALVMASRWQPRASKFDEEALWELAKSIQEIGLINPIVVFLQEDRSLVNGGSYELVAGERRTRALVGLALGKALNNHTPEEYVGRLANVGLSGLGEQEREALARSGATITARVEQAVTEDDLRRLHRVAVMENIERASLSPLEEAHGLASLQEAYGWSQRELAAEIGKSQGYVGQRLSLLDLPDIAQDAVNTRVLNTTHARALSSVPKQSAAAVAKLVVRDVQLGATTREVQALTKKMGKFLDPDRYVPRDDTIYSPRVRNRLRLMRHLVATREPNVTKLKLYEARLLRDVKTTIEYHFASVAKILGVSDVNEAWETFARENGYTCEHCQWHDVVPTVDKWAFNPAQRPCLRWRREELENVQQPTTCSRFIGPDDPAIVSLRQLYCLNACLNDAAVEVNEEPFLHLAYTDLRDFLNDYDLAVVAEGKKQRERKQQQETGHIDDIRTYYEWQLEQPDRVLHHFHAHCCHQCTHFVPYDVDEYDPGHPPCEYVERPLPGITTDHRAPDFAVLVAPCGDMLPRCERFAYRYDARPEILRVSGTRFGQRDEDHDQVLRWIRRMARRLVATRHQTIWAPLQWMDYERPHPQEGRSDVDALIDYLEITWRLPANDLDEQLPTIIDCLYNEANARRPLKGYLVAVELLDPTNGAQEPFVVIDLDRLIEYASGAREWPDYQKWPEDWKRPF